MNTEKKVEIHIPLVDKPNKAAPVKNKHPKNSSFGFIPKFVPQLEEHTESVKWDCVEKTLDVSINETQTFEVYKWIMYIKKQTQETLKGINPDLDNDAIFLKFYEEDDSSSSSNTFYFKKISLDSHMCEMNKDDSDLEERLRHNLVLNYDEVELLHDRSSGLRDDVLMSTNVDNEAADDEWKSKS